MVSTPRETYGPLFEAVQVGRVFPDSKTFVDAVPHAAPSAIVALYEAERAEPGFDLKAFVERHFDVPGTTSYEALAPDADPRVQIERLWSHLTHPADRDEPHSSLIALPHPYVVPGGRFREMYYWDSYFTMLGLAQSGRVELIRHMVDNFASLIDRIGFIPNGNRTYYCTRSQPPYFVLMVELLASIDGGDRTIDRYAPQLEREYRFWMSGGRVVAVGDALLNRHWDDAAEPRQESYIEDVEVAAQSPRDPAELYRDLRAACESGWDFSSRWFDETGTLASIRTTQILPVDLNCLLHRAEVVLAGVKERSGDVAEAREYRDRADARARAIGSHFFDENVGYFVDVEVGDQRSTGLRTLAGAFPLYFGLATEAQARRAAVMLEQEFLRPGGWVTTARNTGQQWDAPNGWAPLQWIVFEGLRRYGFEDLAREGARRWIATVTNSYRKSGRFMEKYDVETPSRAGGGGEYAVQDGFGWTNGVLQQLLTRIGT